MQTTSGELSGGNLLPSGVTTHYHDTVSGLSSTNTGNTTNISSSVNTQNTDSSQSIQKSTNSKSTHLVSESSISSKKESNRNEKTVKSTRDEVIQVYDNKTKSWISVDSKMVDSMESKKTKPAYLRYRSQDTDGSWHTIYKRKVFDNISKQWKYYDEKVIRGNDHLTEVPEIIENAQNITTTTYTTKLYDTKTGKWTIVEEKSYVDKDSVNLTNEIRQELERDRPDVANIITTTESTKVPFFVNSFFSLVDRACVFQLCRHWWAEKRDTIPSKAQTLKSRSCAERRQRKLLAFNTLSIFTVHTVCLPHAFVLLYYYVTAFRMLWKMT